VALAFGVVVFGNCCQQGSAGPELLRVAQDDLRAGIIFFDRTLDGDDVPLKLADVAEFSEISAEHNYRKRTGSIIGAEVEVGDATVAFFDVDYGSGDAVRFPHVFLGLGDSEAVLRR